jgi:hypothetical protein
VLDMVQLLVLNMLEVGGTGLMILFSRNNDSHFKFWNS